MGNKELETYLKLDAVIEFFKPLTDLLNMTLGDIDSKNIEYLMEYVIEEDDSTITCKTLLFFSKNAILKYAKVIETLSDDFCSKPYETSVFSSKYYEQLIEIEGEWFTLESQMINFSLPNYPSLKLQISNKISALFLCYLVKTLSDPNPNTKLIEKIQDFHNYYHYTEPKIKNFQDLIHLSDAFVQISNHQFNIDQLPENIPNLINSISFLLGYYYDTCLIIQKSFMDDEDDELYQLRENLIKPPKSNISIKFQYNSTLIQFYTMGITSYLPNIQYLGFYQVLEFLFTQSSNKLLYQDLSQKMKNPDFSCDSVESLEKIRHTVNTHKQKMNEKEMLKSVLKEFIIVEDLKKFIKTTEKILNKKIFTTKTDYFGKKISLNLTNKDSHLISNIADMIYQTRNALVHSKDSYQESYHYKPYTTDHQKIVELQIPLIRFLAEKIIFSTGKDLML